MMDPRRNVRRALRWVEEGTCRRKHVLRAGDEILARLERTGAATSEAEADGRRFTVARVGFVRPRVVVRLANSMEDVASLQGDGFGAQQIVLADGRHCTLERLSWHGGECVVLDVDGAQLVHVQRELVGGQCGAAIEVEAGVSPETALALALLCWHVLLLELEDLARPVSVLNGAARPRSPRAQLV